MKEKLEKIKQTLEFYATCKSQNSWEEFHRDIEDDGKKAAKSLVLIDSIIAGLDSPKLVKWQLASEIPKKWERNYLVMSNIYGYQVGHFAPPFKGFEPKWDILGVTHWRELPKQP